MRIGRLAWSLGLSLWLGAGIFFSLVVAPMVFTVLPAKWAAVMITRLFPIYYGLGTWFGAVLVAGALIRGISRRDRRSWLLVFMGCGAWGLVISARYLLTLMNRLNPHSHQFAHLHQVSVVVNGAELLLLLMALVVDAWSI